MTWMQCTCGNKAGYREGLKFNGYPIDGWVCRKCGIVAYEPAQAERILQLNKLKKKKMHVTLSQIRSNLILRIPKGVSDALGLKKRQQSWV